MKSYIYRWRYLSVFYIDLKKNVLIKNVENMLPDDIYFYNAE